MPQTHKIPYKPDLTAIVNLNNGDWGLIIAHGENSKIDEGFLPSLAKKLAEKDISSVRFNFPFREHARKRRVDDVNILDQVYLEVWNWVNEKYPDKKWVLAGHDVGAETAIRVSGLVMNPMGQIPPVICLNFPLYPPNRPEMLKGGSLGAIMGDVLFIQAEKSNKGTFDRIKNQVNMMASHAQVNKIGKADHQFNVENKTFDRVAYWISNDIKRFLKSIY